LNSRLQANELCTSEVIPWLAPRPPDAAAQRGPIRINVGCGATPTAQWVNFDNSLTVWLSRLPVVGRAALRAGPLSARRRFVDAALRHDVRWADAARRIPVADASASVVYSSHMFEHLDRRGARRFLEEAWRVLTPSGVLRLVVPDLLGLVRAYQASADADAFVASTYLAVTGGSFRERLATLVLGHRHHAWMYDARSLVRLVSEHGFVDVGELEPGRTTIRDPGALDLTERAGESIYIEARKP